MSSIRLDGGNVAEALWRFFGDGVADVLLQLSDDGTVLYINRVPGRLTDHEVVGTRIHDHLPPAIRPQIRRALAEVFERAETRYANLPIVFEDGTVHWYSASAGPVIFGGRVVAATVVARDMTQQKNAELALRDSEARYRTLVQHAPEAIVVLDLDAGRFVDANPNACALFRLSLDQLLLQDPVALSPARQPDGRRSDTAASEYNARALAGEAPSFEWTHLDANGRPVPCQVRLVRLPAQNRRLIRGSIIDSSDQRGLERQIEQFQKLDTLGQVAGGIAHDFNNILSVIMTSSELLLLAINEGSEAHADVMQIRVAATRGVQLTRQILAFARNREPVRERVDLNAAVLHVSVMLGRLLGPAVTIEHCLTPKGAAVLADRSQLDQILVNLLLNARDAMPDGGAIRIETRPVEAQQAILLRVTDEGTGMDQATMARIFEPFFTTKPTGRGTGLGLSTVSMIVQHYGGRISVASEPGAGTTFEVVLPAHETEPAGG